MDFVESFRPKVASCMCFPGKKFKTIKFFESRLFEERLWAMIASDTSKDFMKTVKVFLKSLVFVGRN